MCALIQHALANCELIRCRAKVKGIPLLESKQLNVTVPTMDDLGPSLPKQWQNSVCDLGSQRSHPSAEWLKRFWTLLDSLPGPVPESLHFFALVRISGFQLASTQYCVQHQALSCTHLGHLPNYAASTLCSIGRVCILEPQADRVSPIKASAEPLTAALNGTSKCLGVPLPQLLSQQRLSSTHFNSARQLLADHVQSSTEAWKIIRQCPIFQDSNGQIVTLCGSNAYGLLPGASWEEHMPLLDMLLPWTPVKYHTASTTQQKLLKISNFACALLDRLPDFWASPCHQPRQQQQL